MTIGLILLTLVLLTCLAAVGIGAFFVRKKVTAMHGMMFAMSMAMGAGLFFGTLLGILFQGDLLLSTVIGMGTGVLAGAVFGSFYSFLALLDGVLSGVMAGMMGAMLGEMIKPEDWDKTVMIMFTIALSICFLLINEILKCGNKQLIFFRIYQNPFIIGTLFVLLCFFLYSLTPFISKPITPPGLHH
ncbi:hypothetical protein [Siminovitchia sp. 179-K 8D1 HS]|uniref:hypothetical protein n=1 Tax=Siminovitchia sp. 179-K 8D1 HS TaxID=3142385 RepID=UPI0039A26F74